MAIDLKNCKVLFGHLKKVSSFLISKMTWIFLIILILVVVYLVYIWYFFIFNSSWSEEKKQQYLNEHGVDIRLDEKRFEKVVDKFSKRSEIYNINPEPTRDIFQLK